MRITGRPLPSSKSLIGAVIVLLATVQAAAREDTPPETEFYGSYRLRFENLDNPFRTGNGSDQLLLSRLLAGARAEGEHLFGNLELEDSRAWYGDAGTPLGTDDVNSLELLQTYIGWRGGDADNRFALKAGRMTLDLGSRRLLARNHFRNTLNAFTGGHADWRRGDWRWQAFYTSPVQRLPGDRGALVDNRRATDRSHSQVQFWGLHAAATPDSGNHWEAYLLGLEEDDRPGFATRNRNIATAGTRLLRAPTANQWDYEVEAAYQFGHSRASASSGEKLLHRAGFVHLHGGYQFDDALRSRLVLQADYASGDSDPTDGENNRFDTLYGARRFEFGPTGIYGAFARGNILSPGVRWQFRANRAVSGFVGYRAVWLASERDSLTTANIGNSDGERFAGHQLEARLRLQPTTGLRAEFGGAYLDKGDLFDDSSADSGNTFYWYSQLAYIL
ncbi:alginate export family protein [Microbulbifer litoralis]|uniref:alginate export family protein n=1 Tax=Microbulbifer litoralis TaxID=2933965 RepID=UPI0020290CA8|nr:alginate export family protein [Microbulbifer sp. GX H0434]